VLRGLCPLCHSTNSQWHTLVSNAQQALDLHWRKCRRGIQEQGKVVALRQMVAEGMQPPVLVFVATKERAKQLHKELRFERIHCDYLCANQSQAARAAAVESFRVGKTWMLISTDLIGRGMDFLGINTVVNYDFPGTKTDYIHRCSPALYYVCIFCPVRVSAVIRSSASAWVHTSAACRQ
jgi:superfamily II DNA/RNA helicase